GSRTARRRRSRSGAAGAGAGHRPRAHEFGHARSRAYTDAVALLKASAKVGHTIAELRGSKFEHSITVRREAAPAGAGRVIEVWEAPSSEPEIKTYKGRPYNAS